MTPPHSENYSSGAPRAAPFTSREAIMGKLRPLLTKRFHEELASIREESTLLVIYVKVLEGGLDNAQKVIAEQEKQAMEKDELIQSQGLVIKELKGKLECIHEISRG